MEKTPELHDEARSFDSQVIERINNGHIPDLRLAQECRWFYNNPWRHPEYVKLDFVEQFELIARSLQQYGSAPKESLTILEVGCGPGYLSLELARAGHDVTGIDVSPECINVAEKTAENDPWKESRGKLSYVQGNFFDSFELRGNSFDAVIFLGALHHFSDQKHVMSRTLDLLVDGGLAIVHEPTRDRVTRGNAVFIHLIHSLLSINNGFYKKTEVPSDHASHKEQIDRLFSELKYEDEQGNKVQSANDNEAGHSTMYDALSSNFKELHYQERYAFFHETIGGLRFDDATNASLARYLRDCDALLCELKVLQPTEFFYVGRKSSAPEPTS